MISLFGDGHSVGCDICGKSDFVGTQDRLLAMETMHNEGWLNVMDDSNRPEIQWCPDCVEKRKRWALSRETSSNGRRNASEH